MRAPFHIIKNQSRNDCHRPKMKILIQHWLFIVKVKEFFLCKLIKRTYGNEYLEMAISLRTKLNLTAISSSLNLYGNFLMQCQKMIPHG